MSRPISYKQLLALANTATAFRIPVPDVTGQTIDVLPNPVSGLWAVLRDHLFGGEYLGERGWATTQDTTVADMYRWDLSQALQQADTAAHAQSVEHAAWQQQHEQARRAGQLAAVVDELLDPIREAVAAC